MTTPPATPVRSYGCSLGCGNPYDFIIVNVVDSETILACMPCYVKLAVDMVAAITSPDDPEIAAKLAMAGSVSQVPMNGSGVRKRGKNAPAEVDDPDIFEAFDSVITVDELPDEFR
jgi:hypothetical protein